MNTAFQSIYNELEQQRVEILAMVKDLPVEQFNYSSSPRKWSISQILTHILTAEQLSLAYMKKKSLGIDQLKDSGIKESIILTLLKISQRLPVLKFKAPAVMVKNTPPPFSFTELSQQWEAHRMDLKDFLEKIEAQNAKKLIYKHPVVGMLDGRQAVVFFREHIIHHLPQIRRCLNTNFQN